MVESEITIPFLRNETVTFDSHEVVRCKTGSSRTLVGKNIGCIRCSV